jgi:curved DNA-binding protein CbpA
MSDPFTLLGMPQRPFLNEEEIGVTYRKLARELHPDGSGGDASAFRALGEAASILKDPSRRLRALLGEKNQRQIPPQAANFFPLIAPLLQRADTLITQHTAASHTLARALLLAPRKALAGELSDALSQIRQWKAALNQELQQADKQWPESDREAMISLADSFAYAGRWELQLRERELLLESLLS